jgi:hypothetical protein
MVNGKYIRILRRGVEVWNEWRKEYPHVYVDLTSADFTDADLAGADLARVDLSLAKLVRVDFTNADLMSADLTRVNLTDAKLMGAKLIDAKLTMPISPALFLTVLTSRASTYIRAPFNGLQPAYWRRLASSQATQLSFNGGNGTGDLGGSSGQQRQELRPLVCSGLAQKVTDVAADRADADAQALGDHLVGQALVSQQLGHPHLGAGQAVKHVQARFDGHARQIGARRGSVIADHQLEPCRRSPVRGPGAALRTGAVRNRWWQRAQTGGEVECLPEIGQQVA